MTKVEAKKARCKVGDKGTKVLGTGADGFIRSHLTEHLAAEANVRAFVYYNSLNSWGRQKKYHLPAMDAQERSKAGLADKQAKRPNESR